MTNQSKTYLDQIITNFNNIVINNFPESVAKATYIDLPIASILTANPLQMAATFIVASTTYELRIQSNELFNSLGFNELLTKSFSGAIGGFFKYSITNQNPYVGMANNAAYELCNSNELCSNNKNINFIFNIAVEAIDASLQAYLKANEGDILGATFSGFKGGLIVGSLINTFVYQFYVPALELKEEPTIDLLPLTIKTCNETGLLDLPTQLYHESMILVDLLAQKLAGETSNSGEEL